MSSVRYRTNKVWAVNYIESTGSAKQERWLDLDGLPQYLPAPRKACGIFFARLRAPVDRVEKCANHGGMDPRLDTVESDLAVLTGDVAVIKRDVAELKTRTQSIELRLVALDQRLTDELPHFATKADLETIRTEFERLRTDTEKMKSDMLKWFIAGWVTMFFSLASLQITLFNLAKP